MHKVETYGSIQFSEEMILCNHIFNIEQLKVTLVVNLSVHHFYRPAQLYHKDLQIAILSTNHPKSEENIVIKAFVKADGVNV